MQETKLLPIVTRTYKSTFTEEELRENSFLNDILEGRISLEDRLESIPKFSYDFTELRRRGNYDGATIQELKKALKQGRKETEVRVTQSFLSYLLANMKKSLEGILFDKHEEIVLYEEPSLEEKRDLALKELRIVRDQEKASKRKLEQAKNSLERYLQQLDSMYGQDLDTFPRVSRFATRLKDEIDSLRTNLDDGSVPNAQIPSYEQQIRHGQDYFSRLVNQLGYMGKEVNLLQSSRDRYSKMLLRLTSFIDRKDAKLRESLTRIKEAEMTKDLGLIVEAADCLFTLDTDVKEIDKINSEIHEIIDAAFDAVDKGMEDNGINYSGNVNTYRDGLYDSKVEEFSRLISSFN